ncbi:aldehyde dehydrogenase family protein [Paenibacillus beijingensis]|uniref:Betaine-aldehyde dehydrogenase n=1 Tax=Paenibacillus beijingensis TaxID=1126833 RepID=A0A0D5NJB0_9BACL|nr:aldehyde dehydrogenase family protein [Paenibacillus beijingensis]AJY75351.1 betaine-aldehyde dehydrogenase [Paenibacillus beijingensis]
MLNMYIGGRWVPSVSGETREIVNPATGETISLVAEGNAEDARLAIEAARKAFDDSEWTSVPARQRAKLLTRLAELIEANAAELAKTETANNGKPYVDAEDDAYTAANVFRYYAGLIGKPAGQAYDLPGSYEGKVVREPIGVCGQIIPWNFPLMMAAWKLAPCLAAGNTSVFKPAELTPLTAIRLFELIEEAGFPPGVANLLLGNGKTAGAELAENMDVDKIAFTGGTETGRSIMRAAASNIKKLSLELGGKSANIVFEDADLEIATDYAVFGIFLNAGQVCASGSRLLIQESIYDEFIELLVSKVRRIRVGNGMNPETEMGPLVSKSHLDKVLNYIEVGRREGATLLTGGNRLTEGELGKGYFVEPTIFTDIRSDMRIYREEIFGPVLVVQKFKDEDDAVRLANDSIYGLAGAVFTSNAEISMRVAKRVRVGIFWVNAYHPAFMEAPWGGYKQSGIGRELGTFGLEEYTEVKQIVHNLEPKPLGYYHWNK